MRTPVAMRAQQWINEMNTQKRQTAVVGFLPGQWGRQRRVQGVGGSSQRGRQSAPTAGSQRP